MNKKHVKLTGKEQVRVGVAVNVVKDGFYLLLKRKSELGTDTWCPPGGKMEFKDRAALSSDGV